MGTNSNINSGPLPIATSIYTEIVRLYAKEHGWENVHKAYKVLLPVKTSQIGIELFSALEDTNANAMRRQGLCPDCAVELIRRIAPGYKDEPSKEIIECPECLEEFPELI